MVNNVSNTSLYAPPAATANTAQDAFQSLLKLLQSSPSDKTAAAADPTTQLTQNLFSQVDTTGKGSITKTDLEQAVTKAGGSKQAADALWAKLDPNNTGSVNAQQFAKNLPKAHGHHHHHGGKTKSSGAAPSIDITINISGGTQEDTGGTAASSGGSVLDTTA
jgi:hypothetical protein